MAEFLLFEISQLLANFVSGRTDFPLENRHDNLAQTLKKIIYKMALREVKKELNEMNKTEIIKLVSEMYQKIPSVKTYLDVFSTGDIEKFAEKYKKQIERYIYPMGINGTLKDVEARKLIREVRKMKITELNVVLELHYVSCCLEIIRDFGYWDDNYYIGIDKMFYEAVSGIRELGLEEKYEQQLSLISEQGAEYGLELYP